MDSRHRLSHRGRIVPLAPEPASKVTIASTRDVWCLVKTDDVHRLVGVEGVPIAAHRKR
jgi:hypothetical protein